MKTKLIKQADVVMLLYLLDDVFSQETKKRNYAYYTPKTLHKSSLSPSIYALMGCRVGDLNRAYNLFNVSLRTDISNFYGNTHEGIHAASLGGTWQVMLFGFAGLQIKKEILSIDPWMPRTWKRMVFSLSWRQNLIKLDVTNVLVKVKVNAPGKKPLFMRVFNRKVLLRPNRVYTFYRKTPRYRPEYNYY